jgi:hypothetical protein
MNKNHYFSVCVLIREKKIYCKQVNRKKNLTNPLLLKFISAAWIKRVVTL